MNPRATQTLRLSRVLWMWACALLLWGTAAESSERHTEGPAEQPVQLRAEGIDAAVLETVFRAAWLLERFAVESPLEITSCVQDRLGAAWPVEYLDQPDTRAVDLVRSGVEACVAQRAAAQLKGEGLRGAATEVGRRVNVGAMSKVLSIVGGAHCSAAGAEEQARACLEKALGRPVSAEQSRTLLAGMTPAPGKHHLQPVVVAQLQPREMGTGGPMRSAP